MQVVDDSILLGTRLKLVLVLSMLLFTAGLCAFETNHRIMRLAFQLRAHAMDTSLRVQQGLPREPPIRCVALNIIGCQSLFSKLALLLPLYFSGSESSKISSGSEHQKQPTVYTDETGRDLIRETGRRIFMVDDKHLLNLFRRCFLSWLVIFCLVLNLA